MGYMTKIGIIASIPGPRLSCKSISWVTPHWRSWGPRVWGAKVPATRAKEGYTRASRWTRPFLRLDKDFNFDEDWIH